MAAVDYSALRAQTMGSGQDDAVTVNTRALIDKVLARYSGEWTVLRELLQNAADASATKVKVRFDTLPSSTIPLPQTKDSSSLLRHTLLHHTIRSLQVTNNGHVFGENDWARLKRIAEGNPDETKIGAFGVGFYSVFDCCEEPFVQSGKEAMAFYWKENGLFTKRLQLPDAQATRDTTFVLDYRDTTSSVPTLIRISQFLVGSMTFVGLTEIELWLDQWKILHLSKLNAPGLKVAIPRAFNTKTSENLMRVESVINETAQLNAKYLSAVGWKPQQAQKSDSTDPSAAVSGSLRTFFNKFSASAQRNAAAEKAAKEEKAAQDALSEKLTEESSDVMFMRVARAEISTNVKKNFAQELERATKKPPPKVTKVAVMTASYTGEGGGLSKVGQLLFSSVIPSKNGKIFIGQITNQTTGLSAHISAQSVIPTVEREAIDLQARWVRTWNQELLRACGIVCRLTWLGEIDSVRQAISQSMSKAGRTKVTQADVEKVLPEAIHVLNSFTFRDSTPSGQIGTLVEEAFWTCNPGSSIEILSTRGVLLSQNVRIGASDLSFVEGIPTVPPQLLEKSAGFVQKLIDYGIITDVTPSDIRKELESQALNPAQLIEFLKWLTEKVKSSEIDVNAARSLLDVTVANDDDRELPIILASVDTFLNPSKIPPSVPIPNNVIPYKYTSGIEKQYLESLGWTSLDIVPWLRWLLGNSDNRSVLPADKDLLHSPEFATQVLQILSKQWDGLSQSSKQTVINLLSVRTIMPTKLGMRLPASSYFPSVRLFDDLPLMTVTSIKEKFAVALGVRKTIDLNLVFERLLKPDSLTKEGTKSWNHVDLVKYLASVRNDIPSDDIKRLTNTPLCPAETPDGPSKERYKASELFEPSDELRALNVKVIQWPGLLRPNTEDGKFLTQIGLRKFPNIAELIDIAYKALKAKDLALHNRTLRYIVAFHATHGYSAAVIAKTTVPFLPLESEKGLTATPAGCYTNTAIAGMGFPILRKDLHMYADRFGVKQNMPLEEAVVWLIRNPPESHRRARELFDYFATRLNELHGESLEMLKQAKIVPVNRSQGDKKLTYLRPAACFLGASGKYGDIFDYVDFGSVANTFLLRLGSKTDPNVSELAWLVVREPARVFSTFNSADRYLELLIQLAVSWQTLKKDKELVGAMRRSPFLLAFKEHPPAYKDNPKNSMTIDDDDEQEAIKTFELAAATQVVIVDDPVNGQIFREHILSAPMEDTIEAFYNSLGVPLLSGVVEEQSKVGPALNDQRPAENLKRLILERMKLFFHGMSKEQIRHDTAWLDSKLQYLAVQSITMRKTLRGVGATHTEHRSAAVMSRNGQLTLCMTGQLKDMYEVSIELLKLCLYVPKPERAIVLTNLLELPLQLLRQRGYNVDRILRRRQQEAKMAEEARQRQIEAEEKRLAEEAESSGRLSSQISSPAHQNANAIAMPGAFENEQIDDRKSGADDKSLWSQFSSMINGDKRKPKLPMRNNDTMGLGPNLPVNPSPNGAIPSGQAMKGADSQVDRPVTQPHELQRNLLNAIKASRAHNGQDVISNPMVNEVSETNTFCDSKPASNIRLLAEVGGMKVFVSNKLDDASASKFMGQNANALLDFANILVTLARALNLSPASMHIFQEGESGTIAFNQNKALFFNYRYFESLHLPDVQQGKKADALIYWFVTLAHELSHNLVSDHSAAHSYYTESFIAMYFAKIAQQAFGSATPAPPPAPLVQL